MKQIENAQSFLPFILIIFILWLPVARAEAPYVQDAPNEHVAKMNERTKNNFDVVQDIKTGKKCPDRSFDCIEKTLFTPGTQIPSELNLNITAFLFLVKPDEKIQPCDAVCKFDFKLKIADAIARYLLNFDPNKLFSYDLKKRNVPGSEISMVIDDVATFKLIRSTGVKLGTKLSVLSEEMKSQPKLKSKIIALRNKIDLLIKASPLKSSYLIKISETAPVVDAYVRTADNETQQAARRADVHEFKITMSH